VFVVLMLCVPLLVLWIAKRVMGLTFPMVVLAGMAIIAFGPSWIGGDGWLGYNLAGYSSALESMRLGLVRPWHAPELVRANVHGLLWIPLFAGAAWAISRRWRWLAYNVSGVVLLAMTGWLAAMFVASGQRLAWNDWYSEVAVAFANGQGGELGAWQGTVQNVLWGLVMAAAIIPVMLLGALAGALAALVPLALWRMSGQGLGFQSRVLSFRHARGEKDVLCRYRTTNPWRGRYKTERVALADFGFRTWEETVTKTVYVPSVTTITGTTSGGQMVTGTAYGPGSSYDKEVRTGWFLVHLRGITASNKLALSKVQAAEANWVARRIEKTFAAPARNAANLLAERTAEQQKQDEVTRVEAAASKARQAVAALVHSAGMSGENWYRYRHDADGALIEVLAADREGRALAWYGGGNQRWSGRWKGATVKATRPALEIVVDDPAYREKHLTDRRVILAETWSQALRDEWVSRIEILAAT
jgi:hypothetical protein